MIGAVGDDRARRRGAERARRGAGVELEVERKGQTGVALIYVDAAGENEIAVFPGANAERERRARSREPSSASSRCRRGRVRGGREGVVLRPQRRAGARARPRARPARREPVRARGDEARQARRRDLRRGRRRAVRERQAGRRLGVAADRRRATGPAPAMPSPPACSSACSRSGGTRRHCSARASPGAYTAAKVGAQSALPDDIDIENWPKDQLMATPIVIDCDPGHDDAIALMLALASPEVELSA